MINDVYIMTDDAELFCLFSITCVLAKHCGRVTPKCSEQVCYSCSTDILQPRKLYFKNSLKQLPTLKAMEFKYMQIIVFYCGKFYSVLQRWT